MDYIKYKSLKYAKDLRERQTETEAIMWKKLRAKRFYGIKFLRQHPIYYTINGKKNFFIADFYNRVFKLVIEIDGKIHEKNKDYDNFRDDILNKLGLNVIRFTNEEVLADLEAVLNKLKSYFDNFKDSQGKQEDFSPFSKGEKREGDIL